MRSTLFSGDDDGPAARCRPLFEIRQSHDPDGALRVTLIGELDLAVSDHVRASLGQLTHAHRRLRLDLSQLQFIDCTGIDGILGALADARRCRSDVEVDRLVSPLVGRFAALAGVGQALWPPSRRPVAVPVQPA